MEDEGIVEVAKVKIDTVITLEFGDRTATLTKLEHPNKFNCEEWFDEEREIYILDETIEEDEPLHWSDAPVADLEAALAAEAGSFGVNRKLGYFLDRTVDSMEVEEPEDEDEEEDTGAEEEEGE